MTDQPLTNQPVHKRAYARPQIVRVKLQHEQAVLAQCMQTSDLRDGDPSGFCDSGRGGCRQRRRSGRNVNYAASS